jgi:hypothetical protein
MRFQIEDFRFKIEISDWSMEMTICNNNLKSPVTI